MAMQLDDAEIRQLRAWAVETALGIAALNLQHGTKHATNADETIAEARKLVNFIKSAR